MGGDGNLEFLADFILGSLCESEWHVLVSECNLAGFAL
jgi:hypothetical protein